MNGLPIGEVKHDRMITDVQWAPLAARSFHMIASASKDRTVIIWRVEIVNLMTDEVFSNPKVMALQKIDFEGGEI